MKRKQKPVEDKAVQPVEDKAVAHVYVKLRPGRSARVGGVLIMFGQVVRVERALAEQWIASGYADYVREA